MKNKCKLVIFSDIHYAPTKPTKNSATMDRKLMHYSIPLINQLIDRINNKIKPDIVVNLGDLVEDFRNHDTDIINLKYIWNLLSRIKPKFYSLAGNHDLRSMSNRMEVEEIMGYEHSTFSEDIKGYHFVFLGLNVDNNIEDKEGGILKTQFISLQDLEWLKKDLNSNKLPCIIFNHFGIAEDDMKDNWWFEGCPYSALLRNRLEVKQILLEHKNVLAVFSGHQHWTKKIIEDGIEYYIVGSLTENINNNGIPDGVYFEVELDKDKINVIEQHLSLDN